MLKSLPIVLTLALLLASPVMSAETRMIKATRADSSSRTQIFINFNTVPEFSHTERGKRIDVILDARLVNTEPMDFPVDERIVKFLTQERDEKTILTFFLRYEPQEVSFSVSREKALVVDILLGNEFTKAYPELTHRLEGLSVENREQIDFSNPKNSNPYADNWRSFFSRYEADIRTTAPIRFTNPPFPVVDLIPDGNGSDILPAEVFGLSAKGLWRDMQPMLLELVHATEDEFTKKQLALTFGESLFRAGDFHNGYRQLYLLQQAYAEEYIGMAAAYLLARLRADHENPHTADFLFRELEEAMGEQFALSPFILLSQIETALATEQFERADKLLQKDDIAFPPRLKMLRELRRADYWFATRDYVKAYVGYTLIEDKSILDQQPSSLNGYCDSLYRQRKFQESSQCFEKLIPLVADRQQLGMINLKKAMAERHYKPAREMYVIFTNIEDTFANTEASYWASVKKTDIRYLSQPSWRKTSADSYHRLAQNAATREIAEEAALKEAIVRFEVGQNQQSIDLLLQFLRDHHASHLKEVAQALLIEVLPRQLEKLLAENNYVEAIVLAKKNRDLFHRNWVDVELLHLLAKAYYELGILGEARNLYLYLLGKAELATKEEYFHPLLSILLTQGDHELIEDLVTQYLYNFPDGRDRQEIAFIHLQSLMATGQNDRALKLLSSPLPDTMEVKEAAALLLYDDGRFDKVVEVLEPLWRGGELTDADSLFILAESFFQQHSSKEAEDLFLQVKDNLKFHDQARYRLASLARDEGGTEKALNLYREIVEKGNDPLWQKMAARELQLHEVNKHY